MSDKQVVEKFKDIEPYATWEENLVGLAEYDKLVKIEQDKNSSWVMATPRMAALWDKMRLTGASLRLKGEWPNR